MADDPQRRVVRCGQGLVEIDLDRSVVKKAGEAVRLTRTEWFLLKTLALGPGRTIPETSLLGAAWGAQFQEGRQFLHAWMDRLGTKIEADPAQATIIESVDGGYRLNADAPEKGLNTSAN